MPKIFKTKKFIIALVIVIIAGWLVYRSFSGSAPIQGVKVVRGNIVQEVTVTGNVKPAHSVDLAFEKSGRVIAMYADVGTRVGSGQILVQLDDSELKANLNKAEADLATQKQNLSQAKTILSTYYDGISDILSDAYTKANDAIRQKTDDLFSSDETNPLLTFQTTKAQNQIDLQSQRLQASSKLNDWLVELNLLSTTNTTNDKLETALANAASRLVFMRNFLDVAQSAIINATNLPQATIDTYKSDISAARSNVDAALANVNGREQQLLKQKAAISSEQSAIASYEAGIESIQAQLYKTSLRSPISGVVTRQDAKVGEIVGINSAITSVISASNFEVEANIPEADIAKVKIGNPAAITLDAYGNDVYFDAKVVSIDPAETIIEGVATYKTKFQFPKKDERVKSGMTANIEIATDKHENVLVVPQRAVASKDGKKTVLLLKNGNKTPEEHEVKTGLRGSDGNVEVVGGLQEGDVLILLTLK